MSAISPEELEHIKNLLSDTMETEHAIAQAYYRDVPRLIEALEDAQKEANEWDDRAQALDDENERLRAQLATAREAGKKLDELIVFALNDVRQDVERASYSAQKIEAAKITSRIEHIRDNWQYKQALAALEGSS